MANKLHDVAALCAAMEKIAPTGLAESWDNVGLLAGDRRAGVGKVMLCIDLMPPVVSEAIRARVGAVVAYHPPIFRPIARLTGPSDAMESQVLRCLEKGIAIYSPHTALDCARRGTNAVLAELCDVIAPRPLEPTDDDPEVGMGRIGKLEPIALGKLTSKLRRRTGARCVSIVGDAKQTVKRAIVGVGAAGSMPFEVPLGRQDVIITGEIRHHDALRVLRVGCSAIALSHWSSERPALEPLAAALEAELPGLKTVLSQRDAEPFVRA
jgi:dinuclear metal center YbgI/SA1388 family protein